MKANQLRWGAVLSYLQIGVSILLGVVYTPIMIRLLGKSEYGLYNTVSSTIGILSLLNLGLGSGYIRYYARYKKENDYEKIYKLNGFFLTIFLIIGAIAFIAGMFLSFNLKLVFSTGLTASEYKTAKVLMIMLTINLAITFPTSVIGNIVVANERYVFNKVLGMARTILAPLLTLPLLFLGFKSIGIVALTLALTVVVEVIQVFYVKKVLKNKFYFGKVDKALVSGVFTYTIFIALNLFVDQINWNIDKLLLGRFKGTGAVAVYSVGYSLFHYFTIFSTAVSGLFTPRIHKIVNETLEDKVLQKNKLTSLFIKVGRLQFLLLALIVLGLVFFGQPFIRFWAGEGYDEAYYVGLLLIIPAIVPFCQNVGIEIQRAQNNHWFRSIVYSVMAVANLIATIFLCQKYGVVGASIGTAASFIICNGLVMNIFYHTKCNIDILAFWKNITRLLLGCLIPACFGVLLVKVVNLYVVWQFALSILGFIVIYLLSQWFIGMNSYEKGLLKNAFGKIFKFKNKKTSKRDNFK